MAVAEPKPNKDAPPQWRCSHCGKLLGQGKMAPGSVFAIKCERCSTVNVREVT
jgi:phage FluMu protein Com